MQSANLKLQATIYKGYISCKGEYTVLATTLFFYFRKKMQISCISGTTAVKDLVLRSFLGTFYCIYLNLSYCIYIDF